MSSQLYPSVANHEFDPKISLRRIKERVVTMSEVHRAPGKVFKDVARNKQSVVVESNGLFIAKIVPYDEQVDRKQTARELQKLLSTMGTNKYTEEEVMSDVLKAQHEVRQTRRKKKKA